MVNGFGETKLGLDEEIFKKELARKITKDRIACSRKTVMRKIQK